MQVAFLNSVIVDQKKKVDELKASNEILMLNKLPDLGLASSAPSASASTSELIRNGPLQKRPPQIREEAAPPLLRHLRGV